jgi:hypothetical protein
MLKEQYRGGGSDVAELGYLLENLKTTNQSHPFHPCSDRADKPFLHAFTRWSTSFKALG